MSAKAPPTPSENRSPKGPGDAKEAPADMTEHQRHLAPEGENQGQAGNTRINTTHQGNKRS